VQVASFAKASSHGKRSSAPALPADGAVLAWTAGASAACSMSKVAMTTLLFDVH
jgi:hypothetical protein